MNKNNPFFFIIAGPNGAGKSTFYDLVMAEDQMFKRLDFINMDIYARELAGINGNPEDFLFEAGRLTRQNINKKLAQRKSFIYETTSAGRSHLKLMKDAKELGFNITTFFIGLEDVELSHLRVQQRIERGGHSVPPEIIERRFPGIIKHFPDMLAHSDTAAVFDNSSREPYQLIFFMHQDRITVYNPYPTWLEKAFEGRKTNKEFLVAPRENIHKLKMASLTMAREIFGKTANDGR